MIRDGGIDKLHSSKSLLGLLMVNFGSSANLIWIAPPCFLALLGNCSIDLRDGADRSNIDMSHTCTSNLFGGCLEILEDCG